MNRKPLAMAQAAFFLTALLAVFFPVVAWTDAVRRPSQPTPILPLDKIRIGMKGYGLTVFKGDKIEPFAVEVVSVMRDFAPKRGMIWAVCPGPRMQHSGPVQAMSGSPIYLWGNDEQHELGKGGKLIGAFAWGFPLSKTCYIGVQPIEPMRQVGMRAEQSQIEIAHTAGGVDAGWMLRTFLRAAAAEGLRPTTAWRAEALALMFPPNATVVASEPHAIPAPLPDLNGQVVPMALPVPMKSEQLSRILTPLLQPMGLEPMATGMITGKPPPGIDPKAIHLEPGSVLAIPMLWGDIDLSATGTCTEILPDGRVLGLGHAMHGQGPTAMPMATGYVHMVVPKITTSFKLGGSAVVLPGAIVRDEAAGVAGTATGKFTTSSMQVDVKMPDRPTQHYHYTLVQHRVLTPTLVAIGGFLSVIAERELPIENTLHVRGTLRFPGGRHLQINSIMPDSSPLAVAFELLPPLAVMMNNPYEPVMLDEVELYVEVEPVNRSALLTHARPDKLEYAPGQTVWITTTYQPYRKAPVQRRIGLPLPRTLPDGRYKITIASAPSYIQRLMRSHPHLAFTESVDDLWNLLDRMFRVRSDALYVLMDTPSQGLALGRHELPRLPSSRRALLATPTSDLATPFTDLIEKMVPLDVIPQGERQIQINVRKDLLGL